MMSKRSTVSLTRRAAGLALVSAALARHGAVLGASAVYDWGYPFPRADAVDPAKVRLWTFGSAAPSPYNTGDILVAVGPNRPQTGDQYGPPFDLKGPLVLCGLDLRPTGRLIGSPFSASNPYMGVNNIFTCRFAA